MSNISEHPVQRSQYGTSNLKTEEPSVALERTPVFAYTQATFSQVIAEHHLAPMAIDLFIDQLPVSVLVAARNGALVYANEAARRLNADSLESVRWTLTRVLLTEDPVCNDVIDLRESGSAPRSFRVDATPIRDVSGAVTAAVLTLTDVTAAKQMAQWKPMFDSLINL
jgi:PAS domain-containing protein